MSINDTDPTESRLAKIDALLRQAESTNHPEEAKTFTAKAEELMAKWNIDAAAVRASRPVQDRRAEVGSVEVVIWYSPMQAALARLVSGLARAHSCQVMYTNTNRADEAKGGKYRKCQVWQVWGMPEAQESVLRLYASCRLQSSTEYGSYKVQKAKLAYLDQFPRTSAGGKGIVFQNSFMLGYASEICTRIRDARAATVSEAERSTPGTSLVLADDAAIVKSVFDDRFAGKLKAGGGTSAGGSALGRDLGRQAARNADLGGSRIGGTIGALS